MKKKTTINRLIRLGVLASLMVTPPGAAWDSLDTLADQWQQEKNRISGQWQAQSASIEQEWDAAEQSLAAEWGRRNAEISLQWQEAVRSTETDWVAYTEDLAGRSRVDFKNGLILLEAVVPADRPDGLDKAKEIIREAWDAANKEKDVTGQPILSDQVADREGRPVDKARIKDFYDFQLAEEVKPEPEVFTPDDGVPRRVYQVVVDLVPQHVHIRADRYRSLVATHAARYDLPPQLIMAVIHTESWFNARAVSHAGAVGLMQIIPRHAGRDVYRYIYKTDRVVTPDFLFNPENNILFGATYLYLLRDHYFTTVRDPDKRLYVVICAYNWGPTNMRERINSRYDLEAMSRAGVYNLLRTATPQETRDYIQRVTERMPIYDPYFPEQ